VIAKNQIIIANNQTVNAEKNQIVIAKNNAAEVIANEKVHDVEDIMTI